MAFADLIARNPISVEDVLQMPDELRSIRLRNNNVRQLIYKEVKKPGRNHGGLWEMLANLHGPPWVKRQFIQEVRQEAVRYIHMFDKVILTSPSPSPNPVLSRNQNGIVQFGSQPPKKIPSVDVLNYSGCGQQKIPKI